MFARQPVRLPEPVDRTTTSGSHLEGHRSTSAHPQLGAVRRRGRVRASGGCDPAGLRPHARVQRAPHPRPSRAGRGPRGRGVRVGDRQGRGVHGDQRAGCDQSGHGAVGRLHGLGGGGGGHRAGVTAGDRLGRVPGVRHDRDHPAGDQAQRAGAGAGAGCGGGGGGVLHRLDRTAGAGARGHPQGRAAGHHRVVLAADAGPARLPAHRQAARQAGARGRGAAAPGAPTGAVRGRWRGQGERARGAAGAGGGGAGAGDDHADGAGGVPRRSPAGARHAGDARRLRGGGGVAGGGPAGGAGRAVRRPGHRRAAHVRAPRQGGARRHRPGRDRQEPGGGRADRR